MTIQELDTAFSNIIKDLQGNGLGNIMAQVGASARQKIYERIHEKGENAEGQKYPPYSTDPMLSGCKAFINKSKCPATTKKGRKELRWVTIKRGGKNYRLFTIPGGYKEFRELNDRQTGFVDFAFRNEMWPTVQLRKDRVELNQGIASIGAISDKDKTNAKLEGNTKRKGEILKLSASEITEITEQFDNEIGKILNKNGL